MICFPTMFPVYSQSPPPKKQNYGFKGSGGFGLSDAVEIEGQLFTKFYLKHYPEEVLKAIKKISFEGVVIKEKWI